MRGISWGGINALQIAAMRPPELKAIMPMGCVVDRYTDDAHYMGGALRRAEHGLGHVLQGPHGGSAGSAGRPARTGRRCGVSAWMRRRRSSRPGPRIRRYDAYWKRGSIATDYAAIQCPVYVVDGWGDPYESIIGELLANLKVPRKGLIGPWGHIFPNLATPLGLDWPYEEVRWWQQWLEGSEHRESWMSPCCGST